MVNRVRDGFVFFALKYIFLWRNNTSQHSLISIRYSLNFSFHDRNSTLSHWLMLFLFCTAAVVSTAVIVFFNIICSWGYLPCIWRFYSLLNIIKDRPTEEIVVKPKWKIWVLVLIKTYTKSKKCCLIFSNFLIYQLFIGSYWTKYFCPYKG